MANYYATARSNYFAVKDEKAFRDWAFRLGLTVLEPDLRDETADGIRRFGISSGNFVESCGWPKVVWNEETCDYDPIEVHEQLSAHLADNEVAVLIEVGNETLRHVTGVAVTVNKKGRIVTVNLDSVCAAARKLGPNITRAEY